jgi:hypothetical protein
MKDLRPVPTAIPNADANDTADPWVKQGLRALREQMPSDESRRATLARLGIADESSARSPVAPAPTTRQAPLVRWLLAGVLLGVLALLLQRYLG